MADPFSGEIRDDRLYGRGALDIKGGVAAMAAAIRALAETARWPARSSSPPSPTRRPPRSARSAGRTVFRADAAIVLEPDRPAPLPGASRLRLARGRDRGPGRPRLAAGRGRRCDPDDGPLPGRAGGPRCSPPGRPRPTRSSGRPRSTPARSAAARPEHLPRPLLVGSSAAPSPARTPAGVLAEIEAIHARLRAADPRYRATTRLQFSRGPTSRRLPAAASPCSPTSNAAIAAQTGAVPKPIGHTAWIDRRCSARPASQRSSSAPAVEGMHAAVEYVRLPDVLACAAVLHDLGRRYCAAP